MDGENFTTPENNEQEHFEVPSNSDTSNIDSGAEATDSVEVTGPTAEDNSAAETEEKKDEVSETETKPEE